MQHKNPFRRKTYGRIFVNSEDNAKNVASLIESMDGFEAEYLPKDFISVYAPERGVPQLVYIGKFEFCKDALTLACMKSGVWIWCVDGYSEEGGLYDVVPAADIAGR